MFLVLYKVGQFIIIVFGIVNVDDWQMQYFRFFFFSYMDKYKSYCVLRIYCVFNFVLDI